MFYLTMQTMGSNSLSLGTSIQVISMAAGSPGEQGVKRSSTITWLLLRDGPRTCRKKAGQFNIRLPCLSFRQTLDKSSPSWSVWQTGPSWRAAWERPGRWCWCPRRRNRLFCGQAAARRCRSGCVGCCQGGGGTAELAPAPLAGGCRYASQILNTTCTHSSESGVTLRCIWCDSLHGYFHRKSSSTSQTSCCCDTHSPAALLGYTSIPGRTRRPVIMFKKPKYPWHHYITTSLSHCCKGGWEFEPQQAVLIMSTCTKCAELLCCHVFGWFDIFI